MNGADQRMRGMARRKPTSNHISPFDDFSLEYDAWFDWDGGLVFRIEVKAFKKLLSDLPEPWIEVGVGSGRFAQALGIETGVDPSSRLLQMARKRGVKTFPGRGEERLFDEASFGTVFLIVTLCFLDSPFDVLEEAHRILAPDGRLVLGLVLKESPWGRFYQQKKAQGHRFYKHANFYTYKETVELMARTGFSTERVVSTLFQKPGEVRQIEDSREGYSPQAGFTIIVAGKCAKPPS
jgi:SAM-dependent methyltransferase